MTSIFSQGGTVHRQGGTPGGFAMPGFPNESSIP